MSVNIMWTHAGLHAKQTSNHVRLECRFSSTCCTFFLSKATEAWHGLGHLIFSAWTGPHIFTRVTSAENFVIFVWIDL